MQSLRHKIYILLTLLLLTPTTLVAVGMGSNITGNKKYTICLDAGHGGKDPGCVGSNRNNREKDIALAIVKEVKRLLRANCSDVKVVCTRETDIFHELGRRAEIANKAKADLFISVHVNAVPRSSVHKPKGVQTYTLALRGASKNLEVEKRENSVIALESGKYYDAYNGLSAEIEIMRELMQQRNMEESVNFAKIVQGEMVNGAGRKDLGVQQGNFAVLRLSYMPSVLLEVGFLSTEEEEQFLMSSEGRNIMARSIYNAIIKYKAKITGVNSSLVPVGTTDSKSSQKSDEVTIETEETTTPTSVKAAKQTVTPAKQATTPTTVKTTSTPAKTTAQASTVTADANCTVFKIQISSGSTDLKETDKQFKGYKIEKYKDGNKFKYFYGASTDYEQVRKTKNDIKADFPNSFIVAFKNGQQVDVIPAIEEWKQGKKK